MQQDGAPVSVLEPESPAGPVEPPRSLTHTTAQGFAWLLGQSLGIKLVTMAGQIVLAWLLSPEDFGKIGLAYTVAAFAALLQYSGVHHVLITRQRHFRRWANSAFWMTMASGGLAALLMIAAAPLAARAYRSPQVAGLLLVLAAAAPLNALSVVPSAKLQSELRFRVIAMLGLAVTVITTLLSIGFAKAGFGAYSFALPQPLVALARTAAVWIIAPVPVSGSIQLRRWRYLLADSGYLLASSVCSTLVMQGDNMMLGLLRSAEVVGIYFFAYSLSNATIQLLTNNLSAALLPALSKLQENPANQTGAFLRAARQIGIIGLPLCLLQAVLAGPLVRLVFHGKWDSAVPTLQVLSVGMALTLMGGPASSLILAQRRFAVYFWWSLLGAVSFLAMVAVGGLLGGAVSVAVAVSIFFAIFGPVGLRLAIAPTAAGWADVGRVYGTPICASLVGIAPPLLVWWLIPAVRSHDLLNIALTALIMLLTYLAVIRMLAPTDVAELGARFWALLRSMVRGL